MQKRNGERKVQITATIDPNVDVWLNNEFGEFSSKAAVINKILKQAMLKDTQYCLKHNISQEGD